jgi:hypothetical protein
MYAHKNLQLTDGCIEERIIKNVKKKKKTRLNCCGTAESMGEKLQFLT